MGGIPDGIIDLGYIAAIDQVIKYVHHQVNPFEKVLVAHPRQHRQFPILLPPQPPILLAVFQCAHDINNESCLMKKMGYDDGTVDQDHSIDKEEEEMEVEHSRQRRNIFLGPMMLQVLYDCVANNERCAINRSNRKKKEEFLAKKDLATLTKDEEKAKQLEKEVKPLLEKKSDQPGFRSRRSIGFGIDLNQLSAIDHIAQYYADAEIESSEAAAMISVSTVLTEPYVLMLFLSGLTIVNAL